MSAISNEDTGQKNSSTFIHEESWLADLLIRVSVDCGKSKKQQTEKLIRPNLSHLLLLLLSEDDLFRSIALSLQQKKGGVDVPYNPGIVPPPSNPGTLMDLTTKGP